MMNPNHSVTHPITRDHQTSGYTFHEFEFGGEGQKGDPLPGQRIAYVINPILQFHLVSNRVAQEQIFARCGYSDASGPSRSRTRQIIELEYGKLEHWVLGSHIVRHVFVLTPSDPNVDDHGLGQWLAGTKSSMKFLPALGKDGTGDQVTPPLGDQFAPKRYFEIGDSSTEDLDQHNIIDVLNGS
ncbi:hypothetical protein DM860_014749 [Cuscuta australis]|uniref:Uncharacterized protein n=1 Tax=Cuscuta australis TaxID=267555 RepID=A0A328D4R4_9ASTE|nr:hypothetical protein DM860_014749 [Cuscuta australis]